MQPLYSFQPTLQLDFAAFNWQMEMKHPKHTCATVGPYMSLLFLFTYQTENFFWNYFSIEPTAIVFFFFIYDDDPLQCISTFEK